MHSNDVQRNAYTAGAIALHWIIATLIFGGFALGWMMTRIPGITPDKLRFYSWHKWIGVTVLALAVLRVLWRLTHRAPPLPDSMRVWQRRAAHLGHILLYVLMIAIPVSGYLYSSASNIPVVYLGIVPLPPIIAPDPELKVWLKSIHITLDYGLLVLVIGHVAVAVKHHWLDGDGLLYRMLPFLK
ncbi:cytochrome b [Trinickia soli]|uniref:cytochrome b n=1 Tax=Trinickia soli TaxID=380675 RepID=UPI003CC839EE